MYAIRAAHAFDGSAFLAGDVTVVVDGERITGVHQGHIDLPDDLELIESSGTLLPGLFDAHTHLVADCTPGGLERAGSLTDDELDAVILASLRAHAAAGVTTVRDLGDRGYRTLGFRQITGLPRVVAAGPPITTPQGHCHFLGGAVADDLAGAVHERVEHGVDVIKVMASGGFATPGSDQLGAQFSADQLRTLTAAAHDAGLPIVAHSHSLLGIEYALEARVDGIEHFSGLSAAGVRIDEPLLDEVARQQVAIDLTMGNDRSLHALMPEPPPAVAAIMARFQVASFDEFYRSRIGLYARLREHGVVVVVGVDSGMAPPKRHGNAWRAVAEMVEGGYPAAEALAAATSVAARCCRLDGETGQLRAGFAADLLLVAGDLSTDITRLGSPELVVIRGRALAADPPALSGLS